MPSNSFSIPFLFFNFLKLITILMSLGSGALKVSGEGPEVIQAPRGGLHGNPASGNHPKSSR